VSGIFLSTAHYAKFLDTVEDTIGTSAAIPQRLSDLLSKTKVATAMKADFDDFKNYLLA
jgi:threonine synthase